MLSGQHGVRACFAKYCKLPQKCRCHAFSSPISCSVDFTLISWIRSASDNLGFGELLAIGDFEVGSGGGGRGRTSPHIFESI